MRKEDFSYGVIYENRKGKKEAINEIESVCPCCGNNDNLKKEENLIGPFRQYIYECDCGTKWRGNCYNENEEVVDYKVIKKTLRKQKRKNFWEGFKDFIFEVGPAILVIIIIIAFIIGCVFLFKNLFKDVTTTEPVETVVVTEVEKEPVIEENLIIKEETTTETNMNTSPENTSTNIEEITESEVTDEEPFETMQEAMENLMMPLIRIMLLIFPIQIILIVIRRMFDYR